MNKEKLLSVLEELDIWSNYVNYEGEPTQEDEIYLILYSWSQIDDLEKITGMSFNNILKTIDINNYIFDDEVYYCDYCNCYHYRLFNYINNYVYVNEEIHCMADFEDNIEDYIEYFINKYDKILPQKYDKKMFELGYSKIEKNYFTGLESSDSPAKILEELRKKYDNVIFYIVDSNPFEIEFGCYVKNDIEE